MCSTCKPTATQACGVDLCIDLTRFFGLIDQVVPYTIVALVILAVGAATFYFITAIRRLWTFHQLATQELKTLKGEDKT